jgi:DNA-directed RNA polymerase specialized sigma24 family protein
MRNGSSDILNDFRQGDAAAFETLFHLHQRAVYGWILRIVRDPAAADPAVTDEIRRKTTLAFQRLPPKLRIAAVLAIVEEQPHKEVAEALGISVSAVKLRVFRALRSLRKDLQQQGITP